MLGLIGAILSNTQTRIPNHVTSEADRVITEVGTAGSRWTSEEFLTSGTWTKPAAVNAVWVLAVGGGAGGGRTAGGPGTQTGGGGGEIAWRLVPVTGNVTVTIGAGGAGATTTVNVGDPGGNTTFGSLLTARGAPGGNSASLIPSGATQRWSYGGGDWRNTESYVMSIGSAFGSPGGHGSGAANSASSVASGPVGFGNGGSGVGAGGGSFGDGGDGGASPTAAAANSGGGGGASTSANTNGAAGGSGRLIVFWQE